MQRALSPVDWDMAIAFAEHARQTHERWAGWRREHDNESIPEAGLLEHHEEYILEYEHTLTVLRTARDELLVLDGV